MQILTTLIGGSRLQTILRVSLLMASVSFLGIGCVTTEAENGGGDSLIGPVEGVLLDPGHGGEPEEAAEKYGEHFASLGKAAKQGYREECYGAISAAGYKEKTATLSISKKIQALLRENGMPTAMTRDSDTYLSLNERVAKTLSPEYRNWVMVSIHFNRSSGKQQATNLKDPYLAPKGFEIYILPGRGMRSTAGSGPAPGFLTVNNTRSGNRLLAQSIEANLSSMGKIRDRGVKEAWFVVLRGSPMPSVLIEGGFLSNPEEGRLIADEEYQWAFAQAVASGIKNYHLRASSIAMNRSVPDTKGLNFSVSSH